MEPRRWVNPTQPQTLQIAVFLLYIDAAFRLLFPTFPPSVLLRLLMAAGNVAGAYGIANEKKWGYALSVLMAFLPLALAFYYLGSLIEIGIITLMFEIALVALLLHPQSREYQRIWFK